MRSQAQKEADKRLSQKIKQYNVKYNLHEMEEQHRLEEYLKRTNQSFTQYSKTLIKRDMETW